jgi:hypothetical protein
VRAGLVVEVWSQFGGFAKLLVILLTMFVASNGAYYLSGRSSYTAGDMLALVGIFAAGLIITVISDRIFRACGPSKDP